MILLASVHAQQICAPCHPREVAAFGQSAMGRSVSVGASQPPGRIEHQRSNSQVTIRQVHGAMEHRVEHRGLTARHEVAYTVGAGEVGFSYLIRVGFYLFQSPVSYYTNSSSWDLTPGYEGELILDFDHPVLSGCLFCHTGGIRFAHGAKDQYATDAISPISCDRCHGPSDSHLRRPSSGTIVNPAKLTGAARDSVCEQCHLEGETRILNAGKDWWDFRAGEPTERTFVTYVRPLKDARIPAVSQAEQLRQSQCSRASGGRLWCGSCHSPHGKSVDTRQVCLECHAPLFRSAKHAPADECKSCHMPALRASNVAHAALTDHRIPRHADHVAKARTERGDDLLAWREPAGGVQDRAKGLAYFESGATHHDRGDLERAYNLLKPMASHWGDTDVEAAVGGMLTAMGEAAAGASYLEQACKRSPGDARLQFLLGEALAAHGELSRASVELEHVIQLDPSMEDAYRKLAQVYKQMGNESMRRRTVDAYLKFMPDSIRFRIER